MRLLHGISIVITGLTIGVGSALFFDMLQNSINPLAIFARKNPAISLGALFFIIVFSFQRIIINRQRARLIKEIKANINRRKEL